MAGWVAYRGTVKASFLLALALVGGACSGADDPQADRLVVVDDESLLSMSPNGTDVVELTTGDEQLVRQPVWSPTGDRVAWTDVTQGSSAVVVADRDGSNRFRAELGFPPFYMDWDPTGSRLVVLGSGPVNLEMGVLDVGADRVRILDTGQPYYLAWSPDGDRMLVHVGADRLELMSRVGVFSPLGETPGSFQAPQWSIATDRILFASGRGTTQTLVISDPDGGDRRELVEFDGFLSFVVSPDGSRVAYRALRVAQGTPASLDAAPLAENGRLEVITVEGDGPQVVSDETPLVFFWSPTGDRLLFLTNVGDEFRWNTWDGASIVSYASHVPTVEYARDYLPFFDQFAQAVQLWSPDGTAFVYPGVDGNGFDAIWVQQVAGGAPVRVSDGSFATWSP